MGAGKASTALPVGSQFTTLLDVLMSLMGWLTMFMSVTTMALIEDGVLPGPRQLDMGND